MKKLLLLSLFISIVLIPLSSIANGGDQRVVEGKYLINLSRAPFTPRVGVKTSMLASFVDLEKNKLIGDDIIARVRIAKLGGGGDKREWLFEKENLIVKGGVLELTYTFTATGLHEIFFDFAFAADPQKVYAAPDFLMDIQGPVTETQFPLLVITGILWAIAGFIAGWFIRSQSKRFDWK